MRRTGLPPDTRHAANHRRAYSEFAAENRVRDWRTRRASTMYRSCESASAAVPTAARHSRPGHPRARPAKLEFGSIGPHGLTDAEHRSAFGATQTSRRGAAAVRMLARPAARHERGHRRPCSRVRTTPLPGTAQHYFSASTLARYFSAFSNPSIGAALFILKIHASYGPEFSFCGSASSASLNATTSPSTGA